ncbi:VOC family protein, partial [Actinomadura adrarensis]
RPDGTLLAWRLTPMRTGPLPFLIDWGTAQHPTETLPIAQLRSVEVVHPEPDVIRAALDALGADMRVRPGERFEIVAEVGRSDGTTFTLR